MSESATKERTQPGQGLYAEHTGRFVRLIDEQAERVTEEYGFTYLYSVDESDAAWFLQSLKLSDDSWRQKFLETVALHRRGRLDEAEKRYKELLSEDKSHKEIEYNLAAICLQRGDVDAAQKHLEQFEKYLGTLPETNSWVQECRARVEELKSEIKQF